MEKLKFNFGHGVKGIIKLLNKMNPKQKQIIPLESLSDECVEISIAHLPAGKWKAFLEWEYEGRDFYYEEDFEVN